MHLTRTDYLHERRVLDCPVDPRSLLLIPKDLGVAGNILIGDLYPPKNEISRKGYQQLQGLLSSNKEIQQTVIYNGRKKEIVGK